MTPRERRPTRLKTPKTPGPSTQTHRGSIGGGVRMMSTYNRGKRPSRLQGAILIGIVMVAVALALFIIAGGGSDAEPEVEPQTVDDAQEVVATEPIPDGPPTPFFASYRSLQLYLPVAPSDLTMLAFHQASGDRAMPMDSLVVDADMEALAARVQGRDFVTSAELAAENDSGRDASSIWQGEALRLWRSNRRGEPDTAADCGAAPGTQVLAPVSGVVLAVRTYDLYGKTEDYEIHIQPDGWPEVDVVLIHVTDVLVSEGDRVYGGLSPIASVRALSGIVDLQLGGYTGDGGDHVHMQLNELPDPAMLEFVGDS